MRLRYWQGLILAVAAASLPCGWAQERDALDLESELAALERLDRSGSYDRVVARLEALEGLIRDGSSRQQARYGLLRARAAALANDPDAALEEITSILERPGGLDPALRLRTLNLATNVLVVEDRFETAFDYFRRALSLAPRVEDQYMRADTYNVAADLHARIGEYSTAIEYASRALEQAGSDEPRQRCIALERRARARLGQYRSAGGGSGADALVAGFRGALQQCQAVPDRLFTGLVRLGLARALRATGQAPETVESELRQAIELLARAGFIDGELEARAELAGVLLSRERFEDAARVMAPTLAWIRQPGSHTVRAGALEVHSRLAKQRGDMPAAYEHYRNALDHHRRGTERRRRMRLDLLMSDLDSRARAHELELLRARNASLQLARENRRNNELTLVYASSGAAVAGLLLFALLVQAGRDRQRLRRLSERDSLTGLLTHTRFFERAEQAFQRARATAEPLSMIAADVDLFKQINDRHGHMVGDSVLRRVGARFVEAFGTEAILGRLGGEEFGVVLPGCDTDDAVARIEHLRAILNRQRSNDAEPAITMSFGVAELAREPTLDVLYAHADQALYDAKDSGRNRVITVARLDLAGGAFVT